MLEEALVVVPRLSGGTVGQARQVFGIGDRLHAASFGRHREQSKVQALDRLTAFKSQLRADAAFILETRDFMAARAAKVTDPPLALFFEARIVHERSVRIARRLLCLLGHEIGSD